MLKKMSLLTLSLRKVVAAAGIQFRMARHWAAVYRQFRLASLHRDPAPKIADSSQQKLDFPDRQWIEDHHWQQFHSEGYMVIRNVVPASIITNAVRDIAAFVGADLADSATWYGDEPQLDGVVPMHHVA